MSLLLEPQEYTLRNALLWGNCINHAKKGSVQGSCGHRTVHLIIAGIESVPGIGQLASLFELFLAACLQQKPSQKPSKEMELKPIATLHPLRKVGEAPYYDEMAALHKRLWKGSPTYRDTVGAIEKRSGQPVAILDQPTAVMLLKQKGEGVLADSIEHFAFRACWSNELNAVVVMKPHDLAEYDKGSVMAFEMTNGYQQMRFDEIHALALKGSYINKSIQDEQRSLDYAAQSYAHAMEDVENEGRSIHEKIIEEAIENGQIGTDWRWNNGTPKQKYARLVNDLILTDYGQGHMQYYRDFYKKNIAPTIKADKAELRDRMKKLAGGPPGRPELQLQ